MREGRLDKNPFLTSAGTLVNAAIAEIDPRKIVGYALNPAHEVGGDKALVFDRVLGYNRSNAAEFMAVIRERVELTPARPTRVNEHGASFAVEFVLTGPSGRRATVRTVWLYRPGSLVPFLTTVLIPRRRSNGQTAAP